MQPRRTLLVTGIDGFTGPHIAAVFQQAGWRVVGLRNGHRLPAHDRVVADLLDPKIVRHAVGSASPDVVLHLAGISVTTQSDADNLYRVNTEGTANLLAALSDTLATPPRVIIASSAHVYGAHSNQPLHEDTQLNPANAYARSRVEMERLAAAWSDRLPVIVTRAFNYTGVGQPEHFVIPKLVQHFARRLPTITLGDTRVRREFLDVRDVARAYLGIAAHVPAGMTVNISSGRSWSIGDALAELTDITGHRPALQVDPSLLRDHEHDDLRGNPDRLAGWVPGWHRTSLRRTLQWMLDAATRTPGRPLRSEVPARKDEAMPPVLAEALAGDNKLQDKA